MVLVAVYEVWLFENLKMELKSVMQHLTDFNEKGSGDSHKNSIEEILKSYLFIFYHHKEMLQNAILLLDDAEIIKIENNSTLRHFWIINDINRNSYRVLDSYCPCPSYFHQIQQVGRDNAICKHMIAISLGTSLKKIESRKFNNEDFVKMLCGS